MYNCYLKLKYSLLIKWIGIMDVLSENLVAISYFILAFIAGWWFDDYPQLSTGCVVGLACFGYINKTRFVMYKPDDFTCPDGFTADAECVDCEMNPPGLIPCINCSEPLCTLCAPICAECGDDADHWLRAASIR